MNRVFGSAWEPLKWFQKTVTPKLRKEDNRAEIEEAKEKLRESGQSNIFEIIAPSSPSGDDLLASKSKKKATSVSYGIVFRDVVQSSDNLVA